MADVPTAGFYDPFVDAMLDGDRLEVFGGPFGPAGIAAVELPDGSVWEVDHLDPSRLVALDVDSADPAGSPLLIAAFGGDGAMRIADRALGSRSADPGQRVDPQSLWGRRNLPDPSAGEAGRLVLLADLARDPSIDPLARTLAVVELTARANRTPVGDLFEPLLPELIDMAEGLASDVDTAELPWLDAFDKRRVLTLERFRARFGDRTPAIGRLTDELLAAREAQWNSELAADATDVHRRSLDEEQTAERAVAPAAAPLAEVHPEDFVGVERVTPELLEVTVARSGDERWVRALRRDGLVLLAQAPLQRAGLMDRGELLLPPDTSDDEIDIQIVDTDQLTEMTRQPADLIRDAVRSGRAAASAERSGDIDRALHRWRECAERWEQVGDPERASLARDRSTTAGGRFRGEPLLADDLDPYGDTGS